MRCDDNTGWLQSGAVGGDGNRARLQSGADSDAVDAAFEIEIGVIDGVRNAAVVSAAPDGGAGAAEVDAMLKGWAALAVCVDGLSVNQGDIGAIGQQARWAGDRGES